MKLAFIGYGELARQIEWMITHLEGEPTETVRFDDHAENAVPFENFIDDEYREFEFVVALGYKHLEKKSEIIENLKKKGRKLKTFVHSSSFKSKSAILEDGVIIYPMCTIDQNVKIEAGTILNNGVIVSHDSNVGGSCFLAPGVIVNGNCRIGSCSFVGSGSIVSNGLDIGKNVQIGIGSVVVNDLTEKTSGIGNPFQILSKRLNLK